MNRWSMVFDQLRKIGKVMVKDDLHDFGYFVYKNREGHKDHPSPLHHWQYGTVIWALSEYLTLLNAVFPFDKEIYKRKLQAKIEHRRARRTRKRQGIPKMERPHWQTRDFDMSRSLSGSLKVFSA